MIRIRILKLPLLFNFMRNIFLLILLLAGKMSCFAQTPAEKLEAGVKIYNAMRDFQDSLTSTTLSQEQIDKVKSMSDRAVAIFDDVIQSGDVQQKETARYFKMNSRYEWDLFTE
jgi:hypoxanthine-guanine phosphoribosyltransferase